MTSRKSISKRKYPSVMKDGKWFTGYENDYVTQDYKDKYLLNGGTEYWCRNVAVESDFHQTMTLTLQPSHTRRGRSAANIIFTDKDGYEYLTSMKSIDNLLHALVSGNITIQDGYFTAEFCQVKQGQNYFIDLVED